MSNVEIRPEWRPPNKGNYEIKLNELADADEACAADKQEFDNEQKP